MKKSMMTGVILSGLLTLTAPLSFVQAGSGCTMKCCQKDSVDEKLKKLTKELNLTAEQQASIKTILEEKKVKQDGVREQMQTMSEETRAKIDAVLTAEQKTKHDAMKKEMSEKMDKKKK